MTTKTSTPFFVGAIFEFTGLPGQNVDTYHLTIVAVSDEGKLHFRRSNHADFQGSLPYERAHRLVLDGIWRAVQD